MRYRTCQKKAKKGIATPKQEIELIKNRLRRAQEHYVEWSKSQKSNKHER